MEPWLGGPVPGIPPLLQPAAHAFLLALEDVETAASSLSAEQLWQSPGGAASAGFQGDALLDTWRATVDRALRQLAATPESTLGDARLVGRDRLPSTVLGLLFHAAEHAQRHTGQLVTTAIIVREGPSLSTWTGTK